MRNKIKQLLKKEGGFTLVELLAVLVILGIIVAIAIPMVGNVIESSKEKAAASQEELIIDAAQLYSLDKETAADVTTDTLIEAGFLENDVKLKGKTVKYDKATDTYTVDDTAAATP